MFKVICIGNKKLGPNGHDAPQLEVGAEYTVIEVREFLGRIGWRVAEAEATPPFTHFSPDYFAPISDIDERDRLEAWQSERLTKVDAMLQALAEEMPEVEMNPGSFERIWDNIKFTL